MRAWQHHYGSLDGTVMCFVLPSHLLVASCQYAVPRSPNYRQVATKREFRSQSMEFGSQQVSWIGFYRDFTRHQQSHMITALVQEY